MLIRVFLVRLWRVFKVSSTIGTKKVENNDLIVMQQVLKAFHVFAFVIQELLN